MVDRRAIIVVGEEEPEVVPPEEVRRFAHMRIEQPIHETVSGFGFFFSPFDFGAAQLVALFIADDVPAYASTATVAALFNSYA